MEIVRLQRTSRILAGHLWIFSNELATSPKNFEPGSIVELRDRKDIFLGIGYINPHSLIAVRILTRQREEINAEFFRKRILDALEYRRRFIQKTNAYRAVFSEGDFLPGLIVDKFNDCLSVQILTAGMEKQTAVILGILDEIFSPSTIVLKNDSAARLLEGLMQEKKLVKGSLDILPVIDENGVRFEIDPLTGQKTGFFLDQKENRLRFREIAAGEGLDLFCYAGAWSIQLASRGAKVKGVDDSEAALVQARRNTELNGLKDKCTFIRADVFDVLKKEISIGSRYGFIVLDPPAFVKSKAKIREAVRGYREINAYAMELLETGGLLATSSCSYHIDNVTFLEMLRSAARDAGRQVRLVEMRSQGHDHPVLLSMPETGYLKCAFLEVQ
jgi:23S rRNA (cytosine1962-C5)-methyltransferase